MPIILKSASKLVYMLLIFYSQQLVQSYMALEDILKGWLFYIPIFYCPSVKRMLCLTKTKAFEYLNLVQHYTNPPSIREERVKKKWNNTISKNRRDSVANLISVQVGHKPPVKIYYVIRSLNKVHKYTTWQHESRFLGYNWLSACLMANSNTPPDTTLSSGETPTTSISGGYSIISQMNYVSVTFSEGGQGQLQNLSFCKIHH